MKKNVQNKRDANYRFIKLTQPLKFDVYVGKKIVIPAGSKDVEIAFNASPFLRRINEYGYTVPMNVYRYKGIIYHG